jgi:hypothetical protein
LTAPNSVRDSHDLASGSPSAVAPRWLQVDEAGAYAGGLSRKAMYALVRAGMRVVRIGDASPHRDSKGRLCQGRMLFCTRWIDEFLESRSTRPPLTERGVDAGKSLTPQHDGGRINGEIATALQRTAEYQPAACPEDGR